MEQKLCRRGNIDLPKIEYISHTFSQNCMCHRANKYFELNHIRTFHDLIYIYYNINKCWRGAVVRRCILIYSSEWNHCFPEFYTSTKSVFNGNKWWCIYRNSLNFHIITNRNLIWVDNGVDTETVPVNKSSFITIKDTFYWGVKLGKTIISFRTVYYNMHIQI